jgi:hypothetical protein
MAKLPGRPIVRALLLCERVLEEKDQVLTLVRLVDTVTVSFPLGTPPPIPVSIVAFASVKGGTAKGEVTFQLKVTSPSGKSPAGKPVEFTGLFQNEETTFNAIVHLTLVTNEEGLYRAELFVKGDQEPQISVPFRITYAAASK